MQTKEDKVAEAAHQKRQQELKQQFNERIQSLDKTISIVQKKLDKTKSEQAASLQTRKEQWTKLQRELASEQQKLSTTDIEFDLTNYNENRLKVLILKSEIAQLDVKHKSLILKGISASQEILQTSADRKEKKELLQKTEEEINSYDTHIKILNYFDNLHRIKIYQQKLEQLTSDMLKADGNSKDTIEKQIKTNQQHIENLQAENETYSDLFANTDSETHEQLYQKLQNTYQIMEEAYKNKKILEIDNPNFFTKELKKTQDELTKYEAQKQDLQDRLKNSLLTDQQNYQQRIGSYSTEYIKFEELLSTNLQNSNFINNVNQYAPTVITPENVESIIIPHLKNLLPNINNLDETEKINHLTTLLLQMIESHQILNRRSPDLQPSHLFEFHEKRADQLYQLLNLSEEPPTNIAFKESIKRLFNFEKDLLEPAYQAAKLQFYVAFLNREYSRSYFLDLAEIKTKTQDIDHDGSYTINISTAIKFNLDQHTNLDNALKLTYAEKDRPQNELTYEIDLIKKYQINNMLNLTKLISEKIDELHTFAVNEFIHQLDDNNSIHSDKIQMLKNVNLLITTQLNELENNLNLAETFANQELQSRSEKNDLHSLIDSIHEAKNELSETHNLITSQLQTLENFAPAMQQEIIDLDEVTAKQNSSIDYHKEFNNLLNHIHQVVQERDNEISHILTQDFSPKKIDAVNNNFMNTIHDHKEKFDQIVRYFHNKEDLNQEDKREIIGYIKFIKKEFDRVEQFSQSYKPSTQTSVTAPEANIMMATSKRNLSNF